MDVRHLQTEVRKDQTVINSLKRRKVLDEGRVGVVKLQL